MAYVGGSTPLVAGGVVCMGRRGLSVGRFGGCLVASSSWDLMAFPDNFLFVEAIKF